MTITRENAALVLRQQRPWALLPQTLAIVAAVARGELAIPEAVERGSRRAELRAASSAPEGSTLALLTMRGLITPRGTFLDELCGGGGGLVGLQAALAEAVDDEQVGAILLDIDSPGGMVDLVPETAAMIRQARQAKPVVAVANTMAASAAYWLAAQADEIVVTPSGLVGSIGVYVAHDDLSGALEQAGVTRTLISAGRFKTDGNAWEPLSDTGRAALQEMVDDVYGLFVADVAAGRGTSEAAVRDGYGQGRVLTPDRAVQAGLADRVEPLEATIDRMLGASPAPPAVNRRTGAAGALSPNEARAALGHDEIPEQPAPDAADEPDEDEPLQVPEEELPAAAAARAALADLLL